MAAPWRRAPPAPPLRGTRGQERAIALEKPRKVRVEHAGDAMIAGVAARAPVRLHEVLGRLQCIPPRIARLAGSRPRVAEVRVGHLGDDLEAQEVVGQVDTLAQRRGEQHGRPRGGAFGTTSTTVVTPLASDVRSAWRPVERPAETWEWMSMSPGVTRAPVASITSVASPVSASATAATLPPMKATSRFAEMD
jgi:hypothetical protein